MKRNPRKVKWTKAYRKLAGKELAEDTTFELECRRNRPEKYNRELVSKTLTAIKRIEKIRTRRQERFHEKRMNKAKAGSKLLDRKELEQQVHLARAPASLLKEAAKEKQKGKKLKVLAADKQVTRDVDDEMAMSD
jgi:large subunit ribosomal protein L24e